MLPPGHLALSYLLGRFLPGVCLRATILGGLLPDIDFVLLPLPVFNQVHRVLTHNLLFVAGVALVIGTVPQWRGRIAASALLGGLVHLLVDACLDTNPSNGIGVALLWPFYDGFFSPINLLQPAADAPDWTQPLAMIRSAMTGLVWELPFYVMALILLTLKLKQTRRSD
ncbi:MAG: metal-dependent hydrolase [Cyanobacteria bacterium P01_A01_bin.114]